MYLPPQFRDEALGLVPGPVDIDSGRNINKEDGGASVGGQESSSNSFAEETGDKYNKVGATSPKKVAAKDRRPVQEEVDPNQKLMMVVEDIVPADAGSGETAPSESELQKAKSSPEEKPLSRAERRKKIKEEILATGEGEGFKGYRRRIW
jgi:hypothetical protein